MTHVPPPDMNSSQIKPFFSAKSEAKTVVRAGASQNVKLRVQGSSGGKIYLQNEHQKFFNYAYPGSRLYPGVGLRCSSLIELC